MKSFYNYLPTVTREMVGEALDELIKVAQGDTGQASKCANFILAWWNGDAFGHFDLKQLTSLDRDLRTAMATILVYLSQNWLEYPDGWGRRNEIEELIRRWRPERAF